MGGRFRTKIDRRCFLPFFEGHCVICFSLDWKKLNGRKFSQASGSTEVALSGR